MSNLKMPEHWMMLVLGVVAGSLATALVFWLLVLPKQQSANHLEPYQANIVKAAAENSDFRHVLFTGHKLQLVVMSIPPGGEVGQETHKHTEQTLYFQSGTGQAILDGKITLVGPGDLIVVTAGTQHNFRNTGDVPLKIITSYAPPNHLDGTLEHTKADADANTADEAFGHTQ